MAKFSKQCLDDAKKALSQFTHDDLKDYAIDVFDKIRSYKDVSGIAAVDRAIKEINNKQLESLFRDCQTKANDISKFEKLANIIKKGTVNLNSILIRRYKNLSFNIISFQKTAKQYLFNKMFSKLSQDDFEFLRKSENESDIIKAVDGKTSSPEAKRIASSFKDYIEYRNAETVISDALPIEYIQADRYLRSIHDSSKMLSGGRSSLLSALKEKKYTTAQVADLWKKTILGLIDIKKTFSRTDAIDINGVVDNKKIDTILDDIFDNIVRGRSDIFSKSEVVNNKDIIKRKRRMFFHWKDFESSMVYNKQYGRGNLFDALMSDVHSSGNSIGLAKLFGSSPYSMFLDLKDLQYKSFKKEPKNLMSWFNKTDTYYELAANINQNAVSPKFAAFNANIRAVTSMAHLFKVALTSVTDVAYVAAYARRYGVNAFHAYGTTLFNMFNLIKSDEERRYVASQFKLMVDSHLGYTARFSDSMNISEVLKKATFGYFRTIGLESFDKGNKISLLHLISKHLFNMRDRSLDKLSDELKLQLSKFDINSSEWDVLRSKSKNGLFTLENVDRLDNDEIKKLYDSSDKSVSLSQFRQNLYNKVYSLFDVAAENAVLTPSAFEKAWCYDGTKPGTMKGELLRHIFQFKMYGISAIDRVLVQGFLDSKVTNSKLAWATLMFAGTLPLSIMSAWLSNISNGLSMPDITKMTLRQQVYYGLDMIEPNFGLIMNLMKSDKNNENLLMAFLKSPSLQLVGDTLAAGKGIANLDPKLIKSSFKHIANDMLPLQVLPMISPYIREAFGEKAFLQPGQKVLYGK